MQVADLDFQNYSLWDGLGKTCKSGPIRPAPTPRSLNNLIGGPRWIASLLIPLMRKRPLGYGNPFEESEIFKVVKGMNNERMLGHDGFTNILSSFLRCDQSKYYAVRILSDFKKFEFFKF